MAAPSRKLYIGVTIAFLLFIPAGLLLHRFGPAMVEAWRWGHLGKPVERKGRVVGYVVSGGGIGPILELDLSGKVVREWSARNDCYGIEVLANGNLLLGSMEKVEEFDREGKVVWKLSASAVFSLAADVSRLRNGNTLVADQNDDHVTEFTPAGAEVWSYKCAEPYSAQRLANGNTLIGSGIRSGRVLEVSPAGEVVWERKEFWWPIHVRRLASGNTLVAAHTQNKVIEVDRDGEVVWEYECSFPMSAERLPDGRTLVSIYERGEIILVSPDGKEEVLYKGAYGRAVPIYEGSR